MFMLLIANEFCLSRRKEAGKLPDTPIIGEVFRHLMSVWGNILWRLGFLLEKIANSERIS
jgi:hypothetical protein